MKTTDLFLGFITNIFVTECLRLSKEKCSACQEGHVSAILHYHVQLGLLDKIRNHCNDVTGKMIQDIDEIIESFKSHLNLENIPEESLKFAGSTYLTMATPESLYYGRYVTDFIDAELFGKPKEPTIEIINTALKRSDRPQSKEQEAKKKKIVKKKVETGFSYYG